MPETQKVVDSDYNDGNRIILVVMMIDVLRPYAKMIG